jgi:hypothetical protein
MKRNRTCGWCIALAVAGALILVSIGVQEGIAQIFEDTLWTKDGQFMSGELLGYDGRIFTFKTSSGVVSVQKERVSMVVIGDVKGVGGDLLPGPDGAEPGPAEPTAPVAKTDRHYSPSVSGYGDYSNGPNLIIDGQMPGEGTSWTGRQCVYWRGMQPQFVIDLGGVQQVNGILVQVDNNDNYRIDYSIDGRQYLLLTDIKKGYGETGSGVDTITSVVGHPEYVPEMAFSPAQARFIKIYATGGDNMYSVSELQVFGVQQ